MAWPSDFLAGKVDVTFDTDDVGQTQGGVRLQYTPSTVPVLGDDHGDGVQDEIYRGGNVFVGMVLAELNPDNVAGIAKLVWAWDDGITEFGEGVIGVFAQTNKAKALVLTPLTGTSLASQYTTWTMDEAVPTGGFPMEYVFQPDLLTLPVRLRCLPFTAPPDTKWSTVVKVA